MEGRAGISMTDFEYTVKVYADAVELGRSPETIPGEYKKAVEFELNQRKEKHILLGDFVRNKMVSAHKNAHEI